LLETGNRKQRYSLIQFSTHENKGIILNIYPNAKIIDITHSVEPQNIIQGAFLLQNYYKFFDEAVHVAVVDPRVGSDREAIIAESKNGIFVAPNNGILSGVLDNCNEIGDILPALKCRAFRLEKLG
jgi:Uncharacterized conserved protein